jgi:hypothetical protein
LWLWIESLGVKPCCFFVCKTCLFQCKSCLVFCFQSCAPKSDRFPNFLSWTFGLFLFSEHLTFLFPEHLDLIPVLQQISCGSGLNNLSNLWIDYDFLLLPKWLNHFVPPPPPQHSWNGVRFHWEFAQTRCFFPISDFCASGRPLKREIIPYWSVQMRIILCFLVYKCSTPLW